ncbi:hypothetical protein BCR32DRAFT_292962 [Anaeromyces robustus]|uniref:MIT domain-containing protein n=1 Tax=Anaeromyces robustus TaxID=1754192 RepID=A0A1Y1X839_9FUNG|nr:hypothetical protein BCR32DRAFT_292962 [Anaeromyces robustus]|eukprot:ORX81917.1 hypothetical protein BCR32DRAFT_292962 [Anaeromyces robustus]
MEDEEEKARRVQELYREALDLAEQAVLADRQKQYDVAICLYNEASNVFNQIIDEDLETTEKIIQIQQKANEYVTRANYLTSKNMNYSVDNYINPNNYSELPSLYHIVNGFIDNNRSSSSSSLNTSTSSLRHNNNNNNNNNNNINNNINNSDINNNIHNYNNYDDYDYNYNNNNNYNNNPNKNNNNNDNHNHNINANKSNDYESTYPSANDSLSYNIQHDQPLNHNETSTNINDNNTKTNVTDITNLPSSTESTTTTIIKPTNSNTTTTINTNTNTNLNNNKTTTEIKPVTSNSVVSNTNSKNRQSINVNEEFNNMKHVIEEISSWNSDNAGGSISNYSFYKNPQYKLSIYPTLGENGFLKAIAKTKNNLPVNIRLVGGGERVSTVSKSDITSGAYRHGQCSFEILSIEPGDYTIIVSTFHRNVEGDFTLTIGCSIPFSLTVIPPEGDGMLETVIDGQWIQGVTAMGCVHYNNYFKNPTYKITINEPTYILIRLQIQTMKPPGMHVAIFELLSDGSPGKEIASSGAYCNLIQGVLTNKILLMPESEYIIIFSTWEPSPGPFTAFIYTTNMIEIQEVCNQ